jgi:hypothetical protein
MSKILNQTLVTTLWLATEVQLVEQFANDPEAVFLVVCDPSMNEL